MLLFLFHDSFIVNALQYQQYVSQIFNVTSVSINMLLLKSHDFCSFPLIHAHE